MLDVASLNDDMGSAQVASRAWFARLTTDVLSAEQHCGVSSRSCYHTTHSNSVTYRTHAEARFRLLNLSQPIAMRAGRTLSARPARLGCTQPQGHCHDERRGPDAQRDARRFAHEHRTAEIRALNHALRVSRYGGSILVTAGIAAFGIEGAEDIVAAVAAFDSFTPDNNPYGLHDCGLFVFGGVKILWLIDYYDHLRSGRTPNAADPRVMTVMRADEY